MRYTETTDDSAVSPVIGVILMVAITVILAAVIGTFVLGLGDNVQSAANVGLSTDQVENESLSVTVVDPGNLDTVGVQAPSGNQSAFASTSDLFAAGAKIEIARGGDFQTIEERNLTTGTYDVNLVAASNNDPECAVSHSADVVSGVQVNKATIPCSGQELEDAVSLAGNQGTVNDAITGLSPNPALIVDENEAGTISVGEPIRYSLGDYEVLGTVQGERTVVQTLTTTRGGG